MATLAVAMVVALGIGHAGWLATARTTATGASDGATGTATREPAEPYYQVYEDPPERVPALEIAGENAQPAAWRWRVNGVVTDFDSASSQDGVPRLAIEKAPLQVELHTGVLPTEARFIVYSGIAGHEEPTTQSGRVIECPTSAHCSIAHRPGNLLLQLEVAPAAPSLIVFMVKYPHLLQADGHGERIDVYHASWVIQVGE